ELEHVLIKRKIRTLSGVAPVAVLTKPFPCPGKCLFCPTEKTMPKSYLSNEPAVMRAIANNFDPFRQVTQRLRALDNNGHNTNKIELIIMGGSWSSLPITYQKNFIKKCFDAANGKKSSNIEQAQKINETAKHRLVAITVETRPDLINEKNITLWRQLGVTKVEMGVQILDDEILKKNCRGHGIFETIKATQLLRSAGFKICYHLMPNLPFSNPDKDLETFVKMYSQPDFRPDFIKIYPTVVTKGTQLYKLWQNKKYKPYSNETLIDLLLKIKILTPEYVRIIRLIRDIPAESISAGNLVSNLREILQKKLHELNLKCHCIRCREAREDLTNIKKAKLFTTEYFVTGGTEIFLQYASPDRNKLYAFLRLFLPTERKNHFLKELKGSAIIREVHTYGKVSSFYKKSKDIQHHGFGTLLTNKAIEISKKYNYKKLSVISGVGVRGFYRKLKFKKDGTYMSINSL
ncbi:MAG: tRNA uridine(34) 5-carboxymethylaminomethyl modification radical SAM/GNAT enzyme Elp3, partial [Patescibacteria group bacterium]